MNSILIPESLLHEKDYNAKKYFNERFPSDYSTMESNPNYSESGCDIAVTADATEKTLSIKDPNDDTKELCKLTYSDSGLKFTYKKPAMVNNITMVGVGSTEKLNILEDNFDILHLNVVKKMGGSYDFTITNSLRSIDYGNGKLVVAGASCAGWSTDGTDLTISSSTVSGTIYSVCYGNGTFVAVGNTATAYYSTDGGATWTSTTMPTASTNGWTKVIYGNGKFVTVSNNTNVGAYSTDGITWTATTMPASGLWQAMTYGNGKFVCFNVDKGVTAYSTDGITWTTGEIESIAVWRLCCYGNDRFVAIGFSNSKFTYSTDGITWTTGDMFSDATNYMWGSICYGNGKFVVVSQSKDAWAYSYNGYKWYLVNNNGSFSSLDICYYPDKNYYVTVGTKTMRIISIPDAYAGGVCSTFAVEYDWYGSIPDGVTLPNPTSYASGASVTVDTTYTSDSIVQELGEWTEGNLSTSSTWKAACYGNDRIVAISHNSNICAYSTDGINWTEGTMPSSQDWRDICYGNGKFVAISLTNSIFAYSTDGINWTEGTLPNTNNHFALCYGNGKFVVVSTSSIIYSTDGINWNTIEIRGNWYTICYGNGMFIVMKGNGIVASNYIYSTDGINWVESTLSSSYECNCSCYGNGKFVVVTTSSIIYSTDGINWTQASLLDTGWNYICYDSGLYIITHTSNKALYSTDGINWTEGNVPSVSGKTPCFGCGKLVIFIYSAKVYYLTIPDSYYSFSGWNKSDTFNITSDTTITGSWSKKSKLSVTYSWTNAPSGMTSTVPAKITGLMPNETVAVDSTYTNKSAYKDTTNKKYYTFSGWNKSGSFNITSNTNITGSWDNGTSVPNMVDLGALTVGSTFFFGKYQVESETPWDIEWEIVHQTDDYQIAMTKQIIDLRAFDGKEPTNTNFYRKNYGNNNWQYSNIEQFLNSDQASWYSAQHSYDAPPNDDNCVKYTEDNQTVTNAYDTHKGFLYYWSDDEKSLLKDYTFTLANNTVADGGGSYTWTGKVWLPTYTQMGGGQNNSVSEGEAFSKFTNNRSRLKSLHDMVKTNNPYAKLYNSSGNNSYWMSSVDPSYSEEVHNVNSGGSLSITNYVCHGSLGLAPCICISRTGSFGVPSDLNYVD